MATIPRGIYRIAVANSVEPQFLTNERDYVTILPPGVGPNIEQEWRVLPANDGNIIIERPTNFFPPSYLTYNNAPKRPEEGNQVKIRVSDFPFNEWHPSPVGPKNCYFLRVADSELGIRVAPPKIYPPFLELGKDGLLEWRFEFFRPLDENSAQ